MFSLALIREPTSNGSYNPTCLPPLLASPSVPPAQPLYRCSQCPEGQQHHPKTNFFLLSSLACHLYAPTPKVQNLRIPRTVVTWPIVEACLAGDGNDAGVVGWWISLGGPAVVKDMAAQVRMAGSWQGAK